MVKESDWDFDKGAEKGKRPLQLGKNPINSSNIVLLIDGELEFFFVQRDCEFTYYVLGGAGEFLVDHEVLQCSEGDLLVVPAGSFYSMRGNMRLLLTSVPPWNQNQEEVRPFKWE